LSGHKKTQKKRMGFVDFEECHEGHCVFDVASCMALMMTVPYEGKNLDKLTVSREVFRGYEKSFQLNYEEKEVLFWAVLARSDLLRHVTILHFAKARK